MTPTARFPVLVHARLRIARILSIALLVVAAVTLGYRFLAPFVAPRLAHLALERLAAGTGEWTARVERIRFEPFALAFELHELRLSARGGDAAAGARLARVDLSLASLISARPVLDRLDIRGGTFQRAPRSAPAFSSLLRILVTHARIAALDAEVAEVPRAVSDTHGSQPSFEVHGTGLDLGVGRGALAVTASSALGDGSRLDAQLTVGPSDAGPLLRGNATLSRGRLALGNWTIAAPSSVVSVEATLSPVSVAASADLLDGALTAIDRHTPDARFELTGGSANGSWHDTGAHEVEASASVASGGRAELALIHPPDGAVRLDVHLVSVPATGLSHYVAGALGVEPASGTIRTEVSVRSGDPSGAGFARITANGLRLAANERIAATAVALLEEPDGEISMDIPLVDGGRAAEQIVAHVAERVATVGRAPFEALAALVGRDAADLSAIEFVPGTADPTPRGEETIAALATALSLRNLVGVRTESGERTELDRAALARSQVMLHVTLATAQAERAGGAAAIDFALPRAQDVLDEFARERLSAAVLEEIGESFPFEAAAPPGAPERVAYYRALFATLVERELITDAALRRLADFRARVVERRLGELGIEHSRVITDRGSVEPSGDGVLALLPLALEPMALDARLP